MNLVKFLIGVRKALKAWIISLLLFGSSCDTSCAESSAYSTESMPAVATIAVFTSALFLCARSVHKMCKQTCSKFYHPDRERYSGRERLLANIQNGKTSGFDASSINSVVSEMGEHPHFGLNRTFCGFFPTFKAHIDLDIDPSTMNRCFGVYKSEASGVLFISPSIRPQPGIIGDIDFNTVCSTLYAGYREVDFADTTMILYKDPRPLAMRLESLRYNTCRW